MKIELLAASLLFLTALPMFAAPKHVAKWVGTWAAAPMGEQVEPSQPSPVDTTYRDIVHTSLAGTAYRVQLTNEFGKTPLKVGAVRVGLIDANGAIEPGTDHAVTFHGDKSSVTIPAGAMVYSNPVRAPLPAESNVAISVFLPQQQLQETTCHRFAGSTNYVFQGNATAKPDTQGAWKVYQWCFVKGVDVLPRNPQRAAAIVAFGDSITDGVHSTRDANRRWPDVLARRLQHDPSTTNLGVLNEAISGNCVLNRCIGPSALRRFHRDVLEQSGVKYLVILEGINDIGASARHPSGPYHITAHDLEFGLKQLVDRAHQHGIKVFGATLTPFKGSGKHYRGYYSDQGELIREAVNHWIRTCGIFDGVIDFDKATRDPSNPKLLAPASGSTDDLHPGDSGYKIMGDSVDLNLFR